MQEWNRAAVAAELQRRVVAYLERTELQIDYYRIGYRFSFRLPVASRPTRFPTDVLGTERPYPWLIWLGWELEERWQVLALASRLGPQLGLAIDPELVQKTLADELGALATWESYDADYNGAGLVTSSLAAACTEIIRQPAVHRPDVVSAASAVGGRILDESVAPWYADAWAGVDPVGLGPDGLQNIRCITLFRAAQLADALGHPTAGRYQAQAARLYAAWTAARAEPEPMTEGTAYDGFLLDSMTGWLADQPDADALRRNGRAALADFPAIVAALTLPGRPEQQAPLGDVEPQMLQWASAAVRLCCWYPEALPAAAVLRRIPIGKLPGWALSDAYRLAGPEHPANAASTSELTGAAVQPATGTLRNGWSDGDPLVAVSAARTPAGHLQLDGGSLVLGRHGRWWITDPGYQQYRIGAERDFTIGPQASNAPVIDATPQTERSVVPRPLEGVAGGLELDLTACCPNLPPGATLTRQVRLLDQDVLVDDRLRGLAGHTVETNWHADSGLSWAFVDGAARLTDGKQVLWLVAGAAGEAEDLGAEQLVRHEGTTGPLRLTRRSQVSGPDLTSWWVFVFDDAATWQPPTDRIRRLIESRSVRG